MRVNPGKLRYAVELQEYTAQQDAIGNQTIVWHTAEKAFAAINSLYGQEYWAAAAQGQQNTLVFVLRWSPVLARAAASADLTRWQLLFEGRSYAIQSVDDMEFRHKLCNIRVVQKNEQNNSGG